MDKLMPEKSEAKWNDYQGFLDGLAKSPNGDKEPENKPKSVEINSLEAVEPKVVDTQLTHKIRLDLQEVVFRQKNLKLKVQSLALSPIKFDNKV